MGHTSTLGACKDSLLQGWRHRVSAAAVCYLLAATLAHAQFHGLVTTDDGRQVYFSSSLRLRGTDQFLHQKIFRIADDKPELVLQVEFQWFFFGGNVGRSNHYALRSPDVSGDGSVVGFVAGQGCAGGSACACLNFDDFEILRSRPAHGYRAWNRATEPQRALCAFGRHGLRTRIIRSH